MTGDRVQSGSEQTIPRFWEPWEIQTALANLEAWGIEEEIIDMLGLAIEIPSEPIHLNVDCGRDSRDLNRNRKR